jgi:uncharacterized repeat protein (TIGR01451 family)
VYDQAGLSAQALDGYELVVWDGLGTGANGLASGTVDALYTAYTNGIPLYLIGERLASAGATLPEPERSEWTALTRLSPAVGVGGDGTVTLHSSLDFNPFFNGAFGTVTSFTYPTRLDIATNLDANTEVVGTSGGADVLLAYPGLQVFDTGQTRLFVQDVRVSPSDVGGSTNVLQSLFDNTVLWLMRLQWCIDTDMSLQASAAPDPAQVGQLLEYGVEVIRGGECEATGVLVTNLLPAGVQFVNAHSSQGTWSYDPVARQVTFRLGYVGDFYPTLTVTVMPVAPGTLTSVVGVRLNGHDVNPANNVLTNVTQVLAGEDLTPTLGIRLVSPRQFELRLSGVANVAYEPEFDLENAHYISPVLGGGVG